MAHRGPAAKANKHGRTPTADWTEVPDEPYSGPSPDLPVRPRRKKYHPLVMQWWEQVREMPHCVLWDPTDWLFALETALMKQSYWELFDEGEATTSAAVEIRRREDQIGFTLEARRKLRIRYIDPMPVDEVEDDLDDDELGGPAAVENVTDIQSRRARLTAAG